MAMKSKPIKGASNSVRKHSKIRNYSQVNKNQWAERTRDGDVGDWPDWSYRHVRNKNYSNHDPFKQSPYSGS